ARIERELAAGRVVVVAGFQGIGDEMEVTTLGRGGSDTTAVAIAVALKAHACEIFTDVRGIYTADPRFVPSARLLPRIAYPEMLELASAGARVMHPRAVEIAEAFSMELHVRSSFHAGPGTIICSEEAIMEDRNRVRGIAHEEHVARLSVVGVPDRPGIAAAIFAPLAEADIAADVIVQTASHEGVTDMSFTVPSADGRQAEQILKGVAGEIGARTVLSQNGLAKVSVVGSGIRGQPGVAATMFSALSERGINIEMISNSEVCITCIIQADNIKDAVAELHEQFAGWSRPQVGHARRVHNQVPIWRGLGSSASAIVAGIILGASIRGLRMSAQRVLELAFPLEGHGDNLAAALHGGFCIAALEDGGVRVHRLGWPERWRAVVFVPDEVSPTNEARRLVPRRPTREDAVFNLGRVAEWVLACTKRDRSLLRSAMDDRLH